MTNELLDMVYPIGSIFYGNGDPNEVIGGKWKCLNEEANIWKRIEETLQKITKGEEE